MGLLPNSLHDSIFVTFSSFRTHINCFIIQNIRISFIHPFTLFYICSFLKCIIWTKQLFTFVITSTNTRVTKNMQLLEKNVNIPDMTSTTYKAKRQNKQDECRNKYVIPESKRTNTHVGCRYTYIHQFTINQLTETQTTIHIWHYHSINKSYIFQFSSVSSLHSAVIHRSYAMGSNIPYTLYVFYGCIKSFSWGWGWINMFKVVSFTLTMPGPEQFVESRFRIGDPLGYEGHTQI